jgi:hypothetical protein
MSLRMVSGFTFSTATLDFAIAAHANAAPRASQA